MCRSRGVICVNIGTAWCGTQVVDSFQSTSWLMYCPKRCVCYQGCRGFMATNYRSPGWWWTVGFHNYSVLVFMSWSTPLCGVAFVWVHLFMLYLWGRVCWRRWSVISFSSALLIKKTQHTTLFQMHHGLQCGDEGSVEMPLLEMSLWMHHKCLEYLDCSWVKYINSVDS